MSKMARRRRFSTSSLDGVVSKVLACAEPSRAAVSEINRLLPPTPISIVALLKAAQNPQPLLDAQFMQRELAARRAYGLSMLLKAEVDGGAGLKALSQQPHVKELKGLYWRRLRALLQLPPITTAADQDAFHDVMRSENEAEVGETRAVYGQALAAVREQRVGDTSEEVEISAFLDSFFSQRVGLRFLVEHFVASRQPRDGFAGLIETDCSPVTLMESLAERTERAVQEAYGASPRIEVIGDRTLTFCFVPSHIEFVLGELVANAAQETIKHHLQSEGGRLTDLPPVKVIMAASDAHVTIKVADTAGGIPRSQLKNVWAYRTVPCKRWGQGIGLGLPLARLYAMYLGGSMHAVPMEGHGTDCYVVFNRLATANCEHILKIPSFSAAAREEAERAAKDSEERPNQGRWRHAIRLFDAQSRGRTTVSFPV